MPTAGLPYVPLRDALYTPAELFAGFDPSRPTSFAETADFAVYRHVVGPTGDASSHRMMQALHDHGISQAVAALVAGRRVAAIMGGHKLPRDSAPYRDVVRLARRLARAGLLVCTGGGPGAMEAGHLGAALAPHDDARLDQALALLNAARQPTVPELKGIVDAHGHEDAVLVAQAHAWFKPAYELAQQLGGGALSLAVPTWHYGHEPSTPLAPCIAKYFQNSIREDGLLAIAHQGIVYAAGRAGTLQEIFQDGAQNYYRTFGSFSPMVLLGVDYWTRSLPVVAVLEKLFRPEDFAQRVRVTDDVDEAAAFLLDFRP